MTFSYLGICWLSASSRLENCCTPEWNIAVVYSRSTTIRSANDSHRWWLWSIIQWVLASQLSTAIRVLGILVIRLFRWDWLNRSVDLHKSEAYNTCVVLSSDRTPGLIISENFRCLKLSEDTSKKLIIEEWKSSLSKSKKFCVFFMHLLLQSEFIYVLPYTYLLFVILFWILFCL